MPRGFLSRGLCPGVFCLGGFCPRTVKHDLLEFKVQCLKVFYCHSNKSIILLFNSTFRTTPEVSSELYFVEIS